MKPGEDSANSFCKFKMLTALSGCYIWPYGKAWLGASLCAHPENRFPKIDNVEDKIYYNRLAFAHVKHVILD